MQLTNRECNLAVRALRLAYNKVYELHCDMSICQELRDKYLGFAKEYRLLMEKVEKELDECCAKQK